MSRPTIEDVLVRLRARQEIDAKVAVVVAHPDDETIGLGPFLHLFRHLTLIHVTDGAPRDLRDVRAAGFDTCAAYAAARAGELRAALQVGGCSARSDLAAEVSACRPGTHPHPVAGDRAHVAQGAVAPAGTDLHPAGDPGDASARFGPGSDGSVRLPVADQSASLDLGGLAACLRAWLAGMDVVFTHAYEGGHPDHDAVAFAVAASGVPVIEMAGYHAAPDGGIEVGVFLGPAPPAFPLTPEETGRRDAMLGCFDTQQRTLAPFIGWTEVQLRPAPAYDFTRLPAARAYYDGFSWGMTGARWCALAAEALAGMAAENRSRTRRS